jgi:hypothetical protein
MGDKVASSSLAQADKSANQTKPVAISGTSVLPGDNLEGIDGTKADQANTLLLHSFAR